MTNSQAKAKLRLIEQWLIQQANAKAAATKDEWNTMMFSSLTAGKLTRAQIDQLNDYLRLPQDTMLNLDLVKADIKNKTHTAYPEKKVT